MKKSIHLKSKVMALTLAVTMAMSSVNVFAASYSFSFGSGTSGNDTQYSSYQLATSSANRVVQQTSSYKTTYYLQNSSGTTVSDPASGSGSITLTLKFKSGYSESNGSQYRLKGVAENYGGRPGYTATGSWYI